jgi:hypothetical protein
MENLTYFAIFSFLNASKFFIFHPHLRNNLKLIKIHDHISTPRDCLCDKNFLLLTQKIYRRRKGEERGKEARNDKY